MEDLLCEFVESMYDNKLHFRKLTLSEIEHYENAELGMSIAIGQTSDLIDRYIGRMEKVFYVNFPKDYFELNSPLQDLY